MPLQAAEDEIIPLSPLRRAIIDKTMQTVNIPYGALSRRVRIDNLLAFKASLAPAFEAKYGLRLTVTHLFFKAAAQALIEAPELNSILDGGENHPPRVQEHRHGRYPSGRGRDNDPGD